MSTTDRLPEPELGYIKTDISNQPAFSARQMREAMQARFQVQGEACPTCGETEPYTGSCGTSNNDTKALCKQPAQATQAEVTDAEIEALFGKCGGHWSGDQWVIEDADLHPFARAILALRPERVPMTNGIRPEDFTVDVVVKSMGGFAQINTKGVRVTHKPTGISVTCDAARSQHMNRHQAFEKLSAILALRPAAVPMTDDERGEAFMTQSKSSEGYRSTFMRGVWAAEAHHGIKPKEQA